MRTVVGVLRGGPSSEYEISLLSGAHVLEHLPTEKYEPRDIFIDRNGQWHVHGRPVTPEKALTGVDAAFNVLHGEYGESGEVQKILEATGIPYTGSDAFSSTVAFNKHATREIVKKMGVKVAHATLIEPNDDIEHAALTIFRSFPQPSIIKPIVGGSSIGMTVADSYHALVEGIQEALRVSPKVLVEEYIKGKEATVGVIDGFRGQTAYPLFPVEIVPPQKFSFLNYEAKYGGEATERCPGNFSDEEKRTLTEVALKVHQALGAQHYSRSDFIVSKRGIYFLEINPAAAVGVMKASPFAKALEAVGATLSEFFDHVVQLALRKKYE